MFRQPKPARNPEQRRLVVRLDNAISDQEKRRRHRERLDANASFKQLRQIQYDIARDEFYFEPHNVDESAQKVIEEKNLLEKRREEEEAKIREQNKKDLEAALVYHQRKLLDGKRVRTTEEEIRKRKAEDLEGELYALTLKYDTAARAKADASLKDPRRFTDEQIKILKLQYLESSANERAEITRSLRNPEQKALFQAWARKAVSAQKRGLTVDED